MEHDLVIPNFHVVLIHLPLGMLIAGTLIELFAFIWRQSSFRRAGRWMLLIGALSAIPAATSGLFAARQALSSEIDTSWRELQNSPNFSAQQWGMLRDHVRLNAAAVILFALLVLAWMGASDRMRSRLHLVFLLLLLVGNGLIVAGAWHGGELVYRFGTGVEQREQKSLAEPSTAPSSAPTTAPAAHVHESESSEGSTLRQRIEHIVPPIQAHLMMAGWAVALALAALGLSIRQITMAPHPQSDEAIVNRQLEEALQPGRALAADTSFNVERARSSLLNEAEVTPPLVPPARFWLVTALLAIVTAALGWWTAGIFQLDQALSYLKDPQNNRGLAHGVLGVSIVVLTIILAMVTRWAGKNKATVLIFALLLLCAVAAQVWMGILLLYDGMGGPLGRFN